MPRPKPTSLKALAIIAVINIVAWTWIYGWKFGWKVREIDPLSSVGLLVMVVVVGIGLFAGRVSDWRIVRALRRQRKTRLLASRRAGSGRGDR